MEIFPTGSSLQFIHRHYLLPHKENEIEIHIQNEVAALHFLTPFLTLNFSSQTFTFTSLDRNKKNWRQRIRENSF